MATCPGANILPTAPENTAVSNWSIWSPSLAKLARGRDSLTKDRRRNNLFPAGPTKKKESAIECVRSQSEIATDTRASLCCRPSDRRSGGFGQTGTLNAMNRSCGGSGRVVGRCVGGQELNEYVQP